MTMYEKEIGKYQRNKGIYAIVKNLTITEIIRLNRLRWLGHVQRMEEKRIPKEVLCMNMETTRLRIRPRNRSEDEVREDGRLVGGKSWIEKVYTDRNGRFFWEQQGIVACRTCRRNGRMNEWKNEWMNEWINIYIYIYIYLCMWVWIYTYIHVCSWTRFNDVDLYNISPTQSDLLWHQLIRHY